MPSKGNKIESVFTGMEIDESLDLHVTAWKIQPVAWALIGVFVLAGLLGAFGTGPLSRSVEKNGAVTINYERFYRNGSVMKLSVRDEGSSSQTIVQFPAGYISHFNISSILPEPSETEMSDDGVIYTFKGGSESRTIVFNLEPQEAGIASGLVLVNDTKINLSHLIYP